MLPVQFMGSGMITEKRPESWQQLQEWTAQILRECGWRAETEVSVKTARGKAEINVFAIETVRGREYKTLIECKNWAARVPQTVVHAFRAVIGDIGSQYRLHHLKSRVSSWRI